MDKHKFNLFKTFKSLFRFKKNIQENDSPTITVQDEDDKIIQKFLEARELKASEIMIPRANINEISIHLDMTLDQISNKFITCS